MAPEAATEAAAAVAAPKVLCVGRLRLSASGFGLIAGGPEGRDVFVARERVGQARDGDEVEVEVTGAGPRGPRGRVVRVLSRAPRRVSGVLAASGRFAADGVHFGALLPCVDPGVEAGVEPGVEVGPRSEAEERGGDDDERPLLRGGELKAAGEGVVVELSRCFGRRGDPRAEEDAILWREQVEESFPAAALEEAERRARAVYGEVGEAGEAREDLRALPFVTIDPASAEDHDDAVFASKEADGTWRVMVAIADASAFFEPGGALDLEARRRGASLYFPSRVVPMLPPSLSAGAASLLPGVDRAAVVLELRLGQDGQVLRRRLALAWVRSRAKLSYDEAGEVLRGSAPRPGSPAAEQKEMLLLLDAVAQVLREKRRGRGAVAGAGHETTIDVEPASGMPLRIERPEHAPSVVRAHQLVEELMLLANESVAEMLGEEGASFLFRVHAAPPEDRVARAVETARRRGVDLDPSVLRDAAALRIFLATLPEASTREALTAALLEVMPSALYASRREDHFALASRSYVHFTSPIRRYADITVHRAIRAALAGKASSPADPAARVDPAHVNQCQERARAIQREVADLYAAILLHGRAGEELAATIVRATPRVWLALLDSPAVYVRCPPGPRALPEGARVQVRIERTSIARRAVEGSFARALGSPGDAPGDAADEASTEPSSTPT